MVVFFGRPLALFGGGVEHGEEREHGRVLEDWGGWTWKSASPSVGDDWEDWGVFSLQSFGSLSLWRKRLLRCDVHHSRESFAIYRA